MDWMLTEEALKEYERDCGASSAECLLLLVGPDGFTGDYWQEMERLTTQG